MCHHCTNRGYWEVSFISSTFYVGFVLLDESILSRNVRFWVFNLKVIPWHLFVQPVKFHISLLQDSIEQGICLPKKPADILRCHKTTSDEGVLKVYAKEMSLPRFGKYFSSFKANFPHGTTNQKHNLDR